MSFKLVELPESLFCLSPNSCSVEAYLLYSTFVINSDKLCMLALPYSPLCHEAQFPRIIDLMVLFQMSLVKMVQVLSALDLQAHMQDIGGSFKIINTASR